LKANKLCLKAGELNWKGKTRFTENQKSFLIERFNIGVQTGHKEDPENVSTLMRNIKNADGSRRFSLAEFLTSQQITSFFSRHCRKNE
jgi:hypothetical protein